jgi:hypothetical protein
MHHNVKKYHERQIKEMCYVTGGEEECIWDFDGKARRKETTRKT